MSDLTEFLRARITEDEEKALTGVLAWGVARVEAECEAKRQILDLTVHGCGDDYERVQRALALPYADHPDFRPEWRP